MTQTQAANNPVASGAMALPTDNRRRRGGLRRSLTPMGFLLPYFLVTAVFFVYPLIYATILSFHMTSGPGVRQYVGVSNFTFVLTDPDFHTALYNTAFFAVCSVCVQLPLSFGLAMMLNAGKDRLRGFFRLAIFAPNLVGQVFVAILFTMLFTPRYGMFNRLVHMVTGFGLEQQWLTDPAWVMPGVVIAALWLYVGFNMIYFLAALQNVSKTLVEAAWIDGAGPWGVFWNVTRPAVMPVATFVVVVSTIGSFQLFELPFILLEGYGPKNSGMTIVGYLYNNAFENGDLGTAAAVGWLLTLIILSISLVQIKLSGTMENDR